jgi:hypothetical protein
MVGPGACTRPGLGHLGFTLVAVLRPQTHCPLGPIRWLLEDAYFLLEMRRASHSLNRSHRVCIGTLGMTSTVHLPVKRLQID